MEEIKKTKFDVTLFKFNLALFLYAFLLINPVILFFYQYNGLSVKELFLFQGIFYIVSIFSEFITGFISDILFRKKVLIISFALLLAVALIWLKMRGFYIVLAGEILFAISKVMRDNSVSGYLYDYLSEKNKNSEMVFAYGNINFFFSAGTAVSALVGTFLYQKYNFNIVLITEIILILIGLCLIASCPDINKQSTKYTGKKLSERINEFKAVTKEKLKDKSLMYYIYYSSLLTACSVFFALSFQPLMQNALFPVFLFGVATFFNHGIRALSGVFAGFITKYIKIRQMIIPLYILYILSFVLIFLIIRMKSIPIILVFIAIICFIIGFQLIFTICHISRLQRKTSYEDRGNIMMLNNVFSRVLSAFILILSFVISNTNFIYYYKIVFIIYIIAGFFLMKQTVKIKEDN